MKNIFKLTDDQKDIIKRCKQMNESEYDKWYLQNVFFPLIVYSGTVILATLYFDKKNILDLIMNGSISLIGINILFGMSSYLIKFDRSKNQIDSARVNLREKLGSISTILIVLGSILYAVQNLIVFELNLKFGAMIVFASVILIFSIKTGIKLFMIRDDFYQKAFDEEMREEQNTLNNALGDL